MKIRTPLAAVSVVVAFLWATAQPGAAESVDHPLILRAAASEIDGILARHGLEQIERFETPASGEAAVLLRATGSVAAQEIVAEVAVTEPDVILVEEALVASLPELGSSLLPSPAVTLESVADSTTVAFGVDENGESREVWAGYVLQAADLLVEAAAAREIETGEGATVAVIDTGIDTAHPLFAGRLVPGYDFIDDEAGGASDWDLLDESSMAILGESSMAILGGEDVAVLNESSMAILGQAQAADLDPTAVPDAFGHGTMVAGIVHLVAPAVKIMPLRVFDGDGRASVFDISRAIRYAVDHGATVINMSFSLEGFSKELREAVSYALENGVACVAAVGNDGDRTVLYPASLVGVLGVASVDVDDTLSEFSNYGIALAAIAAPGESVVTAYPGGGWAAASGTSFAAPWVSGAVALIAAHGGSGAAGEVSLLEIFDALSAAEPVVGLPSVVFLGRVRIAAALERATAPGPPGWGF